jgi:uncharacterized membrane-anchored protein
MQAPDLSRIMGRMAKVPSWVWLALALVVQLAIIGSLVLAHYTTSSTGRSVFLKIAPVDPRDPLRGDYLTFTYDISRVEKGTFATTPEKGQTVYVPLDRQGGPLWVVTGTPLSKVPDLRQIEQSGEYPPDTVFIRGVVQDVAANPGTAIVEVRMVYGIEEYFVPEGKAATFPVTTEDAVAKVVVAKDGKALLQQVYLKGKAWP